MNAESNNDIAGSWRKVVKILEQDEHVSPRQRGFISLAQAQGLIGSTLLLAVPNELTREVLQNQIKGSLDLALREVFREDVLCAISIDSPNQRNVMSNGTYWNVQVRALPLDRDLTFAG